MNTDGKAIERSIFFEVSLFSDASSSGNGCYLENTTQPKACVEGRNGPNESNTATDCQNVNELPEMELYDEGKGKNYCGPLEVINHENSRTTTEVDDNLIYSVPPKLGVILTSEVGDHSQCV